MNCFWAWSSIFAWLLNINIFSIILVFNVIVLVILYWYVFQTPCHHFMRRYSFYIWVLFKGFNTASSFFPTQLQNSIMVNIAYKVDICRQMWANADKMDGQMS